VSYLVPDVKKREPNQLRSLETLQSVLFIRNEVEMVWAYSMKDMLHTKWRNSA